MEMPYSSRCPGGAHLDRTTVRFRDKPEIRNPNSETNPKHQGTNDQNLLSGALFRALGHWLFGFVSDFGFRISDLEGHYLVVLLRCAQPELRMFMRIGARRCSRQESNPDGRHL
jgi:hypothetical protein